jgi:hypothetical protein
VRAHLLAAAGFALAAAAHASRAWADPPSTPGSTHDDLDVPSAPPSAPSVPGPPAEPDAVAQEAAPQAAVVPQAELASQAEVAKLRARLEALEAKGGWAFLRVRDDASTQPTTSFDASPWSRAWVRGFWVTGYVQGQYQQSQLSQDQLDANGNTLNQNRFLVRRARLRFERGWDFASATFEIDGNNVNGLAFGLRRAEASALWRARDPAEPPRLVLTMGLTDIPFGYELFEPNRTRLFMERTTASRAFFPGDTDFGIRAMGAVGFFRYAIGIFDGTPVSDSVPSAAGFDPTSEKDVMARFGVESRPSSKVGLSGGVSFVRGTGFQPGTTSTKGSLQWQDVNQNGSVDPGEIQGVPAQAATPSKTFGRWALGVDLELRYSTPIGRGLAYGEAYVGSDYDRGLVVADPTQTGVDLRELGGYFGIVQEITDYGLVGLRVDAYNPNGDASSQRAGTVLPLDQTITTWSPLVGIVLPGRARLTFEYDHILDLEGLDSRGVPTDLRNDQWALRLQAEM